MSQSNQSLNSYLPTKLFPAEKRILSILRESPQELGPIQVWRKINEDKNQKQLSIGTVKPLLRKLASQGVIRQPYHGTYCDRITYDVRFDPIGVHNLRLRFLVEEGLDGGEVNEVVGGVKIHVHFGMERHLVSGWIGYDKGMNRPTALMAVDRWIEICERKLGHQVKDLVLTSCEVNRDYKGFKLDGEVHCLSVKVLKDTLERVYQKVDEIRQEFRIVKNMTLTQFDMMFNQGLDKILGVQTVADNAFELSELRKAQTYQNRHLLELTEKLNEVIKAKDSEIEELKKLVTTVIESNSKLIGLPKPESETSGFPLKQDYSS